MKKIQSILSEIYSATEYIQIKIGDLAVLIDPPKKKTKKTLKKTTKTNKK